MDRKKHAIAKHTQQGFSLLELMVVIVIIGILASLVVPNLMGSKEKAAKQKTIADITAIENALEMYYLDNHHYPTTEQGLDALVTKPQRDPIPKNYQDNGYLKRLPKDPWGNAYQLISPGINGKVDVFSMGKDGEAGTDEDIGNWNMLDTEQ